MTESRNKSFLRHAAVYGLGTVLLQAASVVLLPLYTHYLTPADFGILEILSRTGQIIGIFLMANGIRLATLTFYRQASNLRDRQHVAATASIFLLIVLLAGALIAVCFSKEVCFLLGIDDPHLMMFGLIVFLLEGGTAVPLSLIQARYESVLFVIINFAMLVFRVSFVVLAVAVLGWGIWGVLAASAVVSITFGLGLTVRECLKGSFWPDWKCMQEMARFALPFVPAGICGYVLLNLDRFYLVGAFGTEEFAVYAVGYKLAAVVGTFSIVPLQRVWSVEVYDVFEQPNAPVKVGRVFTRILASYIFFGLLLCIFQNDIVTLLASSRYKGATLVIGPLVLAYFFLNASTLMEAALYVRRKTKMKIVINIVSVTAMVALCAWLIPRYGALGAASALVGGFFLHAAITFFVTQSVFRVQYEFGRIVAMLGIAIIFTLVAGKLGDGYAAIIGRVALCASWPILLWIIGLISVVEKSWFLSSLCKASCAIIGWPLAEPAGSE